MYSPSLFGKLATASVIVGLLATFVATGGWLIMVPVIAAITVVFHLARLDRL
ncbi:MAG: hypothetical protein ACJ8C4_09815 [Gemmataceae bacterium]